jgi:hypothetical protein
MSMPTSANWMIWPVEPLSEESPREAPSPTSDRIPRRAATPIAMATSTPNTKASDVFTARSEATKMIADMICGPAIMVMASGRMAVFT